MNYFLLILPFTYGNECFTHSIVRQQSTTNMASMQKAHTYVRIFLVFFMHKLSS